MFESRTIEERLTALEREVSAIKRQINLFAKKKDWIAAIEGTFADRPEYDEVIRLGKEIRDAEEEQYPEE